MKKKLNYIICFLIMAFCLPAIGHDFNKDFFLNKNNFDIVLGNKNSKVQVILYSSLSCPGCAAFHKNIFQSIKKEYIDKGTISWINREYIKDLPSLQASKIIRCAYKINTEIYYKFLEVLYEKQANWAFSKKGIEILEDIVKLSGINNPNFQKCIKNKDLENNLINYFAAAKELLNLKSTPAIIINGKIMPYKEISSLELFKDRLEQELTKY